tara:strand:- start:1724 stop:1990 length:267 start_codon:yes stop_codon:yes gene_type:complete
MVELNHNAISLNSDTTIKGSHGVVVAVHVTKAGGSGAKVILKNGGSSGAAEFTVFGESTGAYLNIHRRFESGIYADVTGSAEYLIVYK